ncbi:MAG: ABC transporter permease [Clostridiales bacterium]|nr:ABC transporter permease [Clostridiales bacterium]
MGIDNKRRRAVDLFIEFRSLDVFIIFVLLFLTFLILSPGHRFISKDNMDVFFSIGSEFTIVPIVVGMLMIAGEFDLSVGSNLVFCSFIFFKLIDIGVNVWLSSFLTILVGTFVGFSNGFITVKAKIPSFITTLGTMMLWRGVTLFWSQGLQKALELKGHDFFVKIFTGQIVKFLPVQFLWFIIIALLIGILVHFHRFGNWIYTTGDNKQAARAMGINTDMVKVITFSIVGAVTAFVAIMQIIRVGTFTSRAGDGWELKAIAAAVVGGTALTGGIGSIFGVFWGALIISIIENGLVVLRIPYYWTFTIFGVILVSSAIISLYLDKKRLSVGAAEAGN